MPTPPRPSIYSLLVSVIALSLVIGSAVCAQTVATDDPQVQASRWGTLALMVGKPWLTVVPGEIATVWRLATWVVPGASMRFQRGFCAATACQASDYVVQFDDKARQLEFFENGTMAYTGHVEADGALRMKGTGLLGVLTAETLRHDPATGIMYANAHQLKAGTAQQLASATRGFAPAAAAMARASAPAATAAPAVASAAKADADLRAELAEMKAKVEQLSRQLEQQPAPARPLTPAEARAKAAEDKRQAETRAREEAQAKVAEAQRLAVERRTKTEYEKRQQVEARAREADARAAEVRRHAEERRAQEEAARRRVEEQRARQEAERREAEAARASEAEAARARAAQAAAARQQAAAPPPSASPRPAVTEGPVRPGLYSSGTGYEVDLKVIGDTLVLTERAYSRTSEYRPTSPGSKVYGYRNPNTGTHFALIVQDTTTLVATRFSSSGEVLPNGTPLRFAGGAAEPKPVSRSTFARMEERAQHYLGRAQTDPDNAQAWSFCGMAALAQAHGQNEAQVRQAAVALKSIATTQQSPCDEVISNTLWRSLP